MRWSRFEAAAPALAEKGSQRLEGRVAYIATVRRDGAPRLHPVSPFFGDGCLFVYMEPTSPKVADLRRDGRYALHCGVEDNSGGGEFSVTGCVRELGDEPSRSAAFEAARRAGYAPAARHIVFEFEVRQAMATAYEDGPRRERWSADLPRA